MPTKGRFVGDFGGTKHGWFTEYSNRSIQIYVGDKGAAQLLKPFKRPKGLPLPAPDVVEATPPDGGHFGARARRPCDRSICDYVVALVALGSALGRSRGLGWALSSEGGALSGGRVAWRCGFRRILGAS